MRTTDGKIPKELNLVKSVAMPDVQFLIWNSKSVFYRTVAYIYNKL